MGIPRGHLRIGVTQDLLHLVQATATVDQKTGKAVTQIMDAQPLNPSLGPQPIPSPSDRHKRLVFSLVHEQIRMPVHSPQLGGLPYRWIETQMKGIPDYQIAISAVKLMRFGYVEKSVEPGNDEEYFAYRATEDGLEVFLRHEAEYATLTAPKTLSPRHRSAPTPVGERPSSGFDDMDDDIPF